MAAFVEGGSAVVTGGAGGIGLAMARACLGRGMRVTLGDVDGAQLAASLRDLEAEAPGRVAGLACDVRDPAQVEALRDAALAAHGPVRVLLLNAGLGRPTRPWAGRDAWEETLGVNLWGVVNGLMAFVPGMMEAGQGGAVVVTGSKQGITNPPGNAAYNASKAAVRAVTEQLAWEFRQAQGEAEGKAEGEAGARLTAHLLVPGWTHTGLTARQGGDKPAGAWDPSQVAERMVAGVEAGDFYVICQDNETDWPTDRRRIAWGAGDITENRPALSRWHPGWAQAFEGFEG